MHSIVKYILIAALVIPANAGYSRDIKTIHVYVALCDNINQGIVPVPALLGNGKDLKNNLYWGASNGVKSYFLKSNDWTLVKKIIPPKIEILERLLFRHKNGYVYLIADAYDGEKIKTAIDDFIRASFGLDESSIDGNSQKISCGGNSDLVAFIGHNGLMDFSLSARYTAKKTKRRDVIILACSSKKYFSEIIERSGSRPLLWTTSLMCPEAYTFKSALDGWISGETDNEIRERSARTYDHFQKCGMKGARNLLVTGF
jgi:hypothetical protein